MDCFFHIAGLRLRVKGTLPCKAVEKEWGLFSIGSEYTVENGITDNTTIVCVNQKSVDYLVERYSLPEGLQQAALLRIANPEASLADLAQLSVPSVTKSCLSHRLKKLVELAERGASED